MSEWSTANLYFQTHLDSTKVSQENLDNCVNEMNDVIYMYFKENYGLVEGHDEQIKQLKHKYSGYSKNQLKRQLKRLKSCKDYGLSVEIKFLSRLIRSEISKVNTTSVHNFDHDHEIQRGFWSYCKKVLDVKDIILPLFDKDKCTQYFSKVFKSSKNHEFVLPSWIPHLPEPANSDFNINLPTYQEVTRVIRRMKAGKCPCPLDQVSVIVLKRCPYLRTFLTSIIEKVWQTKRMPNGRIISIKNC